MNQELDVTFLDGTKRTARAIAADFVAFEAKFDLSIARLEREIRLTHLLFLAWHAEKRAGQTQLEFEPWTETVDSVELAAGKK
jgi:hypothetical protein